MKIVDRLLAKLGLMRVSRWGIDSMNIDWHIHEPVHVDIRLKNGQRVVGAVDPWYPNKNPLRQGVTS